MIKKELVLSIALIKRYNMASERGAGALPLIFHLSYGSDWLVVVVGKFQLQPQRDVRRYHQKRMRYQKSFPHSSLVGTFVLGKIY